MLLEVRIVVVFGDRGSHGVCHEEDLGAVMFDFIKGVLIWLTFFCDNSLSKIIISYAFFFTYVKLKPTFYLRVFKASKKFHF